MTYKKQTARTGYLFLVPYGAAFFVFLALPIIVAGVLSVMQFDLTSKETTRFIGAQNYKEMFGDTYFWQALVATTRYVVWMVPCAVITSLAIALGLNAMSKGRNMIRALIFLPGMFTIAVTAIIWQWFYNLEFGFFNYVLKQLHHDPIPWLSDKALAMPSIAMMALWWTAGGTSIIILTSLQQIPKMYFEAAALDGAGVWQLFRHVTFPLLKPVLLFVVLTSTIAAFQMFPQASLLTNGGPELSTRGVVQYIYETAFQNYRLGYAASISWVLAAITMVFGLIQFALMRRNAHA
ncbi:MAG: sugar ABC transporter permease [Armatimonadetes bacterium]|nr:ABC transporter permease subunit [Armatimonadota bacterium]MBS1700329.1 sugar ABC transporter permease [Armatimonadota bacterium]MBS1727770.1 sugar ABC transporter permease [Armatimonadota bacterium]